jgi:hypothetical protein
MTSRWFVVLLFLIYPAVARSQVTTFTQCQFQCGNQHLLCSSNCAGSASSSVPGAASQCSNGCETIRMSCMTGCGQLPFLAPEPTLPLIPIPGINTGQ